MTTDFNSLSPEKQDRAVKVNRIIILRDIITKDTNLRIFLNLQDPTFTRGMLSSGFYPLNEETLEVVQ